MKHALLLVGTKVLAVCGRSPQLPTADTLMLILVAANRYYHTHLSPTTSNTTQGRLYLTRIVTLFSLQHPRTHWVLLAQVKTLQHSLPMKTCCRATSTLQDKGVELAPLMVVTAAALRVVEIRWLLTQ